MATRNDISRRAVLAAATLGPAMLATGAAGAQAAREGEGGRGKVALVTGASRGIGAATARRLARDGYAVAVNYVANADLAAGVVRDIEAAGGRALAVQADVSEPAAARRLFDRTERAFGGVDAVVSNAGVMRLAPFRDMADADFERMMAVNVRGSFNVLREAARRVRDGGRIITLSSSIVQFRSPTYGPYAASKAAQDMYAGVLAKELGARGIAVNAVAPGVVDTPLFTDGKTGPQIQGFVERTPMGRLGRPEDIANAIAALCSGDGAWVSGQTVYVNGAIV